RPVGDNDGPPNGFGDQSPNFGPLFQPDAIAQIVLADGRAYWLRNQPRLPIDASDRALASGGTARTRVRDIKINGHGYRMVTAARPGGGIVQIARATSETEDVLGVLRNRFILIGVIGTLFAAIAGWLLARRTTRPIERLTEASEHIAQTQDLSI